MTPPLDLAYVEYPKKHYFGAHGWVEITATPAGVYRASCHAIEYDEDDVARRCGWVGPARDDLDEASVDAVRHHHDKEGRCRWCSACRPEGIDL